MDSGFSTGLPHPEPRPLTGGAVINAAGRIAVTAAGALTTIVLARLLGPDGWGTYFVAQSLFLILTVLSGLGVEQGIAYYVGSGRWGARAAYGSALKVSLLIGLAGAGVGLGAHELAPSAFAGLTLWLTAAVVVALPFGLVRFYVSYVALATDRYEVYTLMSTLQALLALSLAVPGAILFDLEGAIVATTLSTVAIGIGSALWASGRLPPERTGEPGQLRRAISFGVKGYAANALQFLNYRLDLFILSAVTSTVVVGRYALAVAVTALMWLLPGALSDVLFPRVARLSGRDEEVTREMVETKSVRHASLVTVTTSLLLAAALVLLVVPIFGEDFRLSVRLGLILLPGGALVGISSVLAATVVGRGKPIYTLYGAFVVTPLTVLLYALLIPWLHADGAALASTLSYASTFVLTAWFYQRVTGRSALPLLVPTRSEFDDLRALPRALAVRAGGRRG
jgi:O-antigen/teichoic acid export membrane protein